MVTIIHLKKWFEENKKVFKTTYKETAVCGQLLSVAFGLEGRAGPANPT